MEQFPKSSIINPITYYYLSIFLQAYEAIFIHQIIVGNDKIKSPKLRKLNLTILEKIPKSEFYVILGISDLKNQPYLFNHFEFSKLAHAKLNFL